MVGENSIGIRLAWRSFHTAIRWSASSSICFSVELRAAASCFAALDFGVIGGQTDATTHAIVELGAPKKGARGQYARPEAV